MYLVCILLPHIIYTFARLRREIAEELERSRFAGGRILSEEIYIYIYIDECIKLYKFTVSP